MSETLEKLMDAAEAGIRLKGYHAVSFRDLAEDLGIKSSSVHYYFRQKEDLGLALVKRYSDRFFDALNAEVASEKSPEKRIDAYCRIYRAALVGSDRICLCGMLGAESSGLPDALKAAVAGFFDANIAWVVKALPDELTSSEKHQKAVHIVGALQGAMMLAGSLKDHTVFDSASKDLLAS